MGFSDIMNGSERADLVGKLYNKAMNNPKIGFGVVCSLACDQGLELAQLENILGDVYTRLKNNVPSGVTVIYRDCGIVSNSSEVGSTLAIALSCVVRKQYELKQ